MSTQPSETAADHDHAEGLWDAKNEPHEHFIVPWQILLGVLIVLLVLTMLTVNVAQFERFAAYDWGWQFPAWANIVIALSIAAVKGTLVVMYFMQLRWDKGLNLVLFLFTLFAVMLFLLFTMLDLGGRDRNIDWRAGEVVEGGSGHKIRQGGDASKELPPNTSIVEAAKVEYQAANGLTPEEWEAEVAHHKAEHHHYHHEPDAVVRSGLTPGLFSDKLWDIKTDDHHGDHHDDHSEEHGGDH